MTAKDLADRGVGDSMPELEKFTLNPALAPTRVFTGHANDQAAYLPWDRWATTTGSTSESRPAAADQFPVPAQDGGRCEQQAADGGVCGRELPEASGRSGAGLVA